MVPLLVLALESSETFSLPIIIKQRLFSWHCCFYSVKGEGNETYFFLFTAKKHLRQINNYSTHKLPGNDAFRVQ